MTIKVRTYDWCDGILHAMDHFFEDIEVALGFANTSDVSSVKVYDHENHLIHHVHRPGSNVNTYA